MVKSDLKIGSKSNKTQHSLSGAKLSLFFYLKPVDTQCCFAESIDLLTFKLIGDNHKNHLRDDSLDYPRIIRVLIENQTIAYPLAL